MNLYLDTDEYYNKVETMHELLSDSSSVFDRVLPNYVRDSYIHTAVYGDNKIYYLSVDSNKIAGIDLIISDAPRIANRARASYMDAYGRFEQYAKKPEMGLPVNYMEGKTQWWYHTGMELACMPMRDDAVPTIFSEREGIWLYVCETVDGRRYS